MSRPDWNQYHMSFARQAATRGTCDRAKVGCALVRENRILITGYNGAPSKQPHCDEAGHLMVGGHCVRSAHAECSTLFFAAKHGVEVGGAEAFITHFPCIRCLTALMSAGIVKITYEVLYCNGISEAVWETILGYDGPGYVQLADLEGTRFNQLLPRFENGILTRLEKPT